MAYALRASDADREAVADVLRARMAEGYLSLDTFSWRVERAYSARTAGELESLLSDLPGTVSAGVRGLLARAGRTLGLTSDAADTVAELTPLSPSRDDEGALGPGRLVLGRGSKCDLQLLDTTVSRFHAELRARPEGWTIYDLGSTNGVWVNSERVPRSPLGRGDRIGLGSQQLVFTPRD